MGLPKFDPIGNYLAKTAAVITDYKTRKIPYSTARMFLDDASVKFICSEHAAQIKDTKLCRLILGQYSNFLIPAYRRENELCEKNFVYDEMMHIAKELIRRNERIAGIVIKELCPQELQPLDLRPKEKFVWGENSCLPNDFN